MPRRISLNIPTLLRSRVLFCAVLSVFMVGMRLGIFDYETFFQFHYFPGHDMYQGASFLTTSMHAMRLGGDIAWWNPASFNGYAQYYQSFFSPLAPTSGHIVFIIWAQGIRLLSGVGIAIPEYVQYLTINYIVFPFLAFFMLGCFASLIFRRRVAVFLVVLVYTLSAIGVWNSAWFYFQEPFTLFLLLTGVLAALKYPSRRTLFGLVGAGLIQFTSLNYWTLYNTWFVIVIVGSYCWIYPNQLKHCLLHIFSLLRLQRGLVALLAVGVVLTVSLWSVVLVSTAKEGANYIRTETSSEASTYTKIKAYERVAELRQYTTELFNPDIYRALQYKTLNDVHSAHYIGVFLLPLLALLPFYRWRRVERWLAVSATGILIIVLAPPFLLSLWDLIPMMNRIQHLFYFYSQYWQLLLVMLAAASLDHLLESNIAAHIRKRFLIIVSGLAGIGALVFLGMGLVTQNFPLNDVNLQGNLYFALLLVISSGVILQFLMTSTRRNKRLFIMILMGIALVDLSKYYWVVSGVDERFTFTRWARLTDPLPSIVVDPFSSPWPDPNTRLGFRGNLLNYMPVRNDIWDENNYMWHHYYFELHHAVGFEGYEFLKPPPLGGFALREEALEFYQRAEMIPNYDEMAQTFQKNTNAYNGRLFLHEKFDAALLTPPTAPSTASFSYEWTEWLYNSFGFKVVIPQDGWLRINQITDPNWNITIDGKPVSAYRANFMSTAFPISAGAHQIRMDYMPVARRIYWIAVLALEITLAFIVICVFWRHTRRIHSDRNAQTFFVQT